MRFDMRGGNVMFTEAVCQEGTPGAAPEGTAPALILYAFKINHHLSVG